MGELNLEVLASFLGWLIIANFAFTLFRVFIFGGAPKSFIYKIHHTFFFQPPKKTQIRGGFHVGLFRPCCTAA